MLSTGNPSSSSSESSATLISTYDNLEKFELKSFLKTQNKYVGSPKHPHYLEYIYLYLLSTN